MPCSPEFTTPKEDSEPQPQNGDSEGREKVSKTAPCVLTRTSKQKTEAILVDISQLQPTSPPDAKPVILMENLFAKVGSLSEKATKEAIEALVEGFERSSLPYPSLLQTFLLIPCQALQNLKKVNPELHSKMVHAVLTMIRTGDQAEILEVFDNDKNLVQSLTKLNPDVNQSFEYTNPPLCWAVWRNTSKADKLIRILVGLGADVNIKGQREETALYNAVRAGRTETVKLLVSLGADVNIPATNGTTPLREAFLYQKYDMIQTLLSFHASYTLADLNNPKRKETPLYNAAASGDEEKVKLLVSMGANVNQPGAYPPLWRALFTGSLSMIKFLIDHGAQVKLEHVNYPFGKKTSLYNAVASGDEEKVKFLASMGANVNQPSGAYDKPPLWKALFTGSLSMIKFLIEHGAHVKLEHVNFPWEDETPLYYAVASGMEEKVKLLISLGANINQPSGAYDKPPLWKALFTGSLSMIKLLIDHGAQVTAKDVNYPLDKYTPLIWILFNAPPHERLELVKLLISLGADCNLPDGDGYIPLSNVDALPSSEGKPIYQLLIDHGADKEWHESFSALKGIAHSWALGGQGKVYNVKTHTFQTIKLTGWFRLCSLKFIRKLFQDFVEEQMKPMGSEYQTVGRTILKILDRSGDYGWHSTELCKELVCVSESEPVFLPAAISGHATVPSHFIGFVVHQNRIYLCNRGRGAGKSPGIKEYEFNRKLETELLFFIQKAISGKESWDGLKATFDALQPCLKRVFHQREQKVGNCSWTSYESGLHALFRIFLEAQTSRRKYPVLDWLDLTNAFTIFSRKKTLLAYLQVPKPDPSVLQQIEGKLRNEDEDSPFSSEDKEELLKRLAEKIHFSK